MILVIMMVVMVMCLALIILGSWCCQMTSPINYPLDRNIMMIIGDGDDGDDGDGDDGDDVVGGDDDGEDGDNEKRKVLATIGKRQHKASGEVATI